VRPTVRFGLVLALTVAYTVSAVYVGAAWRSDLEAAIGPVAAWVIPALLAYLPGSEVSGYVGLAPCSRRCRPIPPGRS
jgi:hypothetical protein